MSTVKAEATLEAIGYLKRVIASAMQEGASSAAIDGYVASQGVQDPATYRGKIERSIAPPRLLSDHQLKKLGGRNDFRRLFGLPPVESKPADQGDHHLTESGDAELFAEMYADVLRYDQRRERWLHACPVSGLWLQEGTEQIMQLALKTMRERQARAMKVDDHAARKAMFTWAMNGESHNRLTNLIKLARTKSPILDDGEHWDEHALLLGCANGVVNLETGECRKADTAERITMKVAVAYDPAATCPLWEQTISEIFTFTDQPDTNGLPLDGSPEDRAQSLVDFVQRAIGYSLTGDCSEECLFICWGTGRNGKGTIITVFYQMMGDYAETLSMGSLEAHDRDNGKAPRPDIAKLPGKRLVVASEAKKTATLDEELIKKTTGRDPIAVRHLFKPEFTFIPAFKLWLQVNNKPQGIREDDVAMWARIHLIPFLRSFTGHENKKLKDRLKAEELPGILAWAVRGAMAWKQGGLQPPAAVRQATQEYRNESDTLAQFIDERCVRAATASTKSGDLLAAYLAYCHGASLEPAFNHKTFTPALVARGFTVDASKPKQYTWIKGIGLSEGRP